MYCFVCKKSLSKYKCPICLVKYCSVGCYKFHKEEGSCVKKVPQKLIVELPEIAPETVEPTYEFETEDTVSPTHLALLGNDPCICNFLSNQHLRDILIHLNSLRDPYHAVADAMKVSIFEEFATKCLEIVKNSATHVGE